MSEFELREPANLCFSGDELVSQDEDRETVADLRGDSLYFITASDTGREVGCKEHVAVAKVGTVINEDNALDVARAIACDVASEVCKTAGINNFAIKEGC